VWLTAIFQAQTLMDIARDGRGANFQTFVNVFAPYQLRVLRSVTPEEEEEEEEKE